MYKAGEVCFVTFLATVAWGYPAAVNDIADFDTIRKLELENTVPIQKNDVRNLPEKLVTMNEENHKDDIPVIKNRPSFNGPLEKDEEPAKPEYIQPDWSAQGSYESDEESEREKRWVGGRRKYSFSSEDDNEDSHECDEHNHEHDKEVIRNTSGDSKPEESLEEKKKKTNAVVITKTKTKLSEDENKRNNEMPSTEPALVQSTTIAPEILTSTPRPAGRINIDPRFGVGNSAEVRDKRMAWNVARYYSDDNKFHDNTKPAKMRWLWDDQRPDFVPPVNDDVVVDDTYVEKPDFFRPLIPVVNLREPCESKYERRDSHGRCRLALLR